jgi:hypothetical protein
MVNAAFSPSRGLKISFKRSIKKIKGRDFNNPINNPKIHSIFLISYLLKKLEKGNLEKSFL